VLPEKDCPMTLRAQQLLAAATAVVIGIAVVSAVAIGVTSASDASARARAFERCLHREARLDLERHVQRVDTRLLAICDVRAPAVPSAYVSAPPGWSPKQWDTVENPD
jgi:hypothetical protein